jgi:hypothetical protein
MRAGGWQAGEKGFSLFSAREQAKGKTQSFLSLTEPPGGV